jgi:hypothetical protein
VFDLTPILKTYVAARRAALARIQPARTQQGQLSRLVRAARDTRFGRDHGFSSVRSVRDFQQRVPLRRYEDLQRDYWQASFPLLRDCTWPGKIDFFALSSGTTTGASKYVPCSKEFLRLNRRTGLDVIVHHLADRPNSQLLAGKNFLLAGSTQLTQLAPGIQAGDLSGIGAAIMPWWARSRVYPPPELSALVDWEQKIERIARELGDQPISSISGLPSWVLIFLDVLMERAPAQRRALSQLLPRLELICHGGISFVPYRAKFDELLRDSSVRTREIYPSSEAFVAVADRGPGEGLRLTLDQGTFFEFVPLEELNSPAPRRHWIGDVEYDVNYAVAVSTCSGLWSYLIGDTVRFVEKDPARVLMTGRTAHQLSLVGEHLITEEVDGALSQAASQLGLDVVDYTLSGGFSTQEGARGRHHYLIEFRQQELAHALVLQFASLLDAALQTRNRDYYEHRANGYGLHVPRVHPVPRGLFASWMKARGKLGGQNKVPRMIADPSLWQDLTRAAGVTT